MEDIDGAPRKYSSSTYTPDADEIEEIVVRPSTEIIPDEYEHNDNKQGLVFIFYSSNDIENKNILRNALSDLGYIVSENNLHLLSTKENVLKKLQTISRNITEDKTCLLLIFMGNLNGERQFLLDDGSISVNEVWCHFTSNTCRILKYKPKIFIFQGYQKTISTTVDHTRSRDISIPKKYDIPAEADIAVVYKTVTGFNRNKYVTNLCNNFDEYGLKEDLFSIVTLTDPEDENQPLVVSTLTRKFYVTSSKYRGHYHDIFNTLKHLHELIDTLYTHKNIGTQPKNEDRKGKVSSKKQTSVTKDSKLTRSQSLTTNSTAKEKKDTKPNNSRPPWKGV